jgi:type I restriction enzyme M protein
MKPTLTQAGLEKYLWDAAILLRGFIDAGDYKQFIFPLLFWKRLCDVYDEESERAERERGEVFREDHRLELVIPQGAHWNDVRQKAKNVGAAIQSAMRAISKDNPQLYGIFGDAPWTNKNRLSDETLRNLIEHFSSEKLTLARVSDDMLGKGYEYLIKKFADDSGHTAAEFYTNRTVVRLMTQLLDPQPGESVYDPTCGSGGMLLEAAMELRDQGREYRNLRLYGQEINLMTSAMARMNLFMHGFEDFEVVRGDTLAAPAFIRDDELRQFDVVLANPPYSIKQWDRDAWATDRYGRNFLGVPPQGRADYAFLQHIVKSLKPASGRCAILFPHGILFRDEERAMRTRLLGEHDLVECVIGLGPNLFYNSPMEACVLICRRNKDRQRQNRVLFINAINRVTRRQAQSFLDDHHIAEIVQAYQAYTDMEGFARVVSVEDILTNGGSLSISLYIRTPNGRNGSEKALGVVIADWQASSGTLRKSMQELFAQLKPEPVQPEPLPIRLAVESARLLSERLNEMASVHSSVRRAIDESTAASKAVREAHEAQLRMASQTTEQVRLLQQGRMQEIASIAEESRRAMNASMEAVALMAEESRRTMQQAMEALTRPLRDIAPIINPFGGFLENLAATLPRIEPMTFPQFQPLPLPDFTAMVEALRPKPILIPPIDFSSIAASREQMLVGLSQLDEVVKATQRAYLIDVPALNLAETLLGSLTANDAMFLHELFDESDDDEFDDAIDYISDVLPFEELPTAIKQEMVEFKAWIHDNPIAFLTLLLFTFSMLEFIQNRTLPTANEVLRDVILLLLWLKEATKDELK